MGDGESSWKATRSVRIRRWDRAGGSAPQRRSFAAQEEEARPQRANGREPLSPFELERVRVRGLNAAFAQDPAFAGMTRRTLLALPGTAFTENGRDFGVVVLCDCKIQGSLAIVVPSVDVRSTVEEQPNHLRIVSERGRVM